MASSITKRQQQRIEESRTSSDVEELAVSTAKRGVIYVIGDAFTSVLTLVLLIALARLLMPSDFGVYSIVIAFSTLLGIGSNFGIGTAFRKMLPEIKLTDHKRISSLLSSGYAVSLLIGIAIAVAGVLLSNIIAVWVYHNPSYTVPLMMGSIAEFFSVMFNLSLAALVSVNRVKHATISNAVYSSVSLVLSVALVLLGFGIFGSLIGYVLGLLGGALVGLGYLFIGTGYRLGRPNKKDAKKLTVFSIPVVTSHVALNGATNFAVLFLGVFVVAAVVGNYGAAYKIARFVDLTITDVALILLPAFSMALSRANIAKKIGAIYNNSIYYTAILLFPILAYAIAVSGPLIRLLVSSAYTTAPFYFAVMIAGMGVGVIGTYAGSLVVGFGNTKKFMIYQVSAVAVQLLLLVLLTPLFKGIGVLVALFVITPIVLDFIYIRALRHQFRISHQYKGLILVAISSVVMLAIMYAVTYALHQGYLALVVNLAVMLALYPMMLALFRAANRENLDFVRKTADRLPILRPLVHGFVRYSSLFIKG